MLEKNLWCRGYHCSGFIHLINLHFLWNSELSVLSLVYSPFWALKCLFKTIKFWGIHCTFFTFNILMFSNSSFHLLICISQDSLPWNNFFILALGMRLWDILSFSTKKLNLLGRKGSFCRKAGCIMCFQSIISNLLFTEVDLSYHTSLLPITRKNHCGKFTIRWAENTN